MRRAIIATLAFAAAMLSTMAHGQDDHGNTRTAATSVAFPSATSGTIDPGTDDDYFSFTLSTQTTVIIDDADTAIDSQGWLYDSGGMRVTDNDDGGPGNAFRIERTLSAGTYYVRVRSFGTATGDYILRVYERSADSHGNARSSATSVALYSETSGLIYNSNDEDYFSFTLSAAGSVTIQTTGHTDTVGHLYNSSGTQLATDDDGGSSDNFRITQATLSAGTYYVRVTSYSDHIGPYTLLIDGPPIVTIAATGNCGGTPANCGTGGDRDTTWPGLQVDEGDTVTFTSTISPTITTAGSLLVSWRSSGSALTVADLRRPNGTAYAANNVFIVGTPSDIHRSNQSPSGGTVHTTLIHSDGVAEDDETLTIELNQLTSIGGLTTYTAAPLTAEPAPAPEAALPTAVAVAAGETAGTTFAAAQPAGSPLTLRADAPPMPTAQCSGTPCFRGFETVPGSPLILFHRPPRPLAAPAPEPLAAGDPLRLPLASLVAPGDAPDGMAWEASSSDASVATAHIVGAFLLVQPEPASEGTARITLVATDALGLRATVRFEVQVEFHWPHNPSRGWRSTLGNATPTARQ